MQYLRTTWEVLEECLCGIMNAGLDSTREGKQGRAWLATQTWRDK